MIRPTTLCAVVALAFVSAPLNAQGHPFESFPGSYEVVRSTIPAPDAQIEFRAVAAGLGIHSVWLHGEADTLYEAHALWGYDPTSGLVTILEVNSAGVVATHVGRFDQTGALTVERRDEDRGAVLERRRFWWSGGATLEMTLDIFSARDTVHHEVTLVRR